MDSLKTAKLKPGMKKKRKRYEDQMEKIETS